MKRQISFPHICFPAMIALLFAGCMKDKITATYTISVPIYQTLTAFRETIKSQPASDIMIPGKLTVAGRYIFLSEPYKGIHVIDNINPASPKNVAFINIPGNEDMAIKGNTLFADAYSDLVSFDISNPLNAVAKNFAANVFPDNSIYYTAYNSTGTNINPNDIDVIVGWATHDTTVDYNPPGNMYAFPASSCANCFASVPVPTAFTSNNAAASGKTGTDGPWQGSAL